jgi:S1-C subfamily serine protease
MYRHIYWAGPLAALVLAMLFFGVVWNMSAKVPTGFYEPSPHVRLEAGISMGSGVHIGDGLVITAAHVVGKNKSMKAFADDNRMLDGEAEVLWTNTKYDIALVRVASPKMKAAPLSCAPNFTSQAVTAHGNPMGVHAVYTRGEVVGPAREWMIWASVVPVAGPIIYGQSGGGVMDDDGNVVGIAVGLLMTQAGIASFGWVVPSKVVCSLLGRA